MEVGLKAGVWPDLDLMQRTIKKAGYEPILDDVRLTATGVVRRMIFLGDRVGTNAREPALAADGDPAVPDPLVLELDGMKAALDVDPKRSAAGARVPPPSVLRLGVSKESPTTLDHLAEKHLGQKVTIEGVWVKPVVAGSSGTLEVLSVLQAKPSVVAVGLPS